MSIDETELVARMQAICDEFEAYGYRRVGTALRQRRVVVNHKKICRLMCERDLQPKRRRRYVATTDSDHECPIFPNRARDMNVDGANQLWVADITYIAIATGLRLSGGDPRCLVAPCRGLCYQPLDRRPARCRGAESCYPDAPAAGRLRASFRQSEDNRQFPGGLTLTAIDLPARLAPQGARCGLTRTPIDQPCLSPDLSTARERLAVRLCLADARDPRRA
jgi:hypothetical protein